MPEYGKRILLEDTQGVFVVDRSRIVQEQLGGSLTCTKIPGRLSVSGQINGNNRRYPRAVWENNLREGSTLQEAIKANEAFGLLEHPKDGNVDLLSPISHLVTEARLEGDEVVGAIRIVNTEEGRKLTALIEAGYNPTVSSRGYGSLAKSADGVDEVQNDYVCEGWDVVIKPSFASARLNPARESIHENAPAPAPVPSPAPLAPPAPAPISESNNNGSVPAPTATKKSMTSIEDIKARLRTLESVDPTKLDARRIAEGLQEAAALHQAVSAYGAEDPTRAYAAQTLHRSIEVLESKLSSTAEAPKAKLAKINEAHTKLLRVTKTLTETGLKYRSALTETRKALVNTKKMSEEVVKRGKGWKRYAESLASKYKKLKEDFDVATEALDVIADRYKSDMTTVGRRLLTLEFKDKLAANADAKKKLDEAKVPEDIVSVRKMLEGAPKAKSAAAPKPVNESKPAPAAPSAPAPAAPPAPAASGIDFMAPSVPSVRNVNESVEMARRLSTRQ